MATGYEVGMYRDLEIGAQALRRIADASERTADAQERAASALERLADADETLRKEMDS
jgi:hypothetical protein